MVQQYCLGVNYIFDCYNGKVKGVWFICVWVNVCRICVVYVVFDYVGVNNEKFVCIDCFVWIDKILLLVWFIGYGVWVGNVLIYGQCMVNKDGI